MRRKQQWQISMPSSKFMSAATRTGETPFSRPLYFLSLTSIEMTISLPRSLFLLANRYFSLYIFSRLVFLYCNFSYILISFFLQMSRDASATFALQDDDADNDGIYMYIFMDTIIHICYACVYDMRMLCVSLSLSLSLSLYVW